MIRSADFQIGPSQADLEVGVPGPSIPGFKARFYRGILTPAFSLKEKNGALR
jgi:hypothetical protein